MDSYVILTNRKRVLIALAHTAVFLSLAVRSVAKPSMVNAVYSLRGSALAGAIAILLIYLIVTTVLLQLTRLSKLALERLYFGLCATSAGFGLLRYWLGDPTIHVAIYLRVIALTLAVGLGVLIWLGHTSNKTVA